MTSQVMSKQNFRVFGIDELGEQNIGVKRKQSQLIGMDSVTDICKHHFLCFVTIIQVKVISGHQVKSSNQNFLGFRAAIHVFRVRFSQRTRKITLKTF